MPPTYFLFWFVLIWAIGPLFFPFSRRIFGSVLPDGGLAVGRVLFLGLWTLGAFWAGNFGVSTRHSVLIGVLLGTVGAFALAWQKREIGAEFRARKRAIWASETIFLLVFLAFFLLRGFWSDTSGTNGEKAMDSALIGSLVRAERLPPPNPYAAGRALSSYYYFGHLQAALLSCTINAPVRWSYNLMCATLPALCFSTLFSLGAALTGRLRGGVWVAASVLGLGTLEPIYQWLHPERFGPSAPFRLDFFAVSRVIPYSINEFPFFTFNQSDLHAHYFDFPFALTTICLCLVIYRGHKAAIWPAILILGAQIMTNTWDFPAYALLIAFSVAASKLSSPAESATTIEGSTGIAAEAFPPIESERALQTDQTKPQAAPRKSSQAASRKSKAESRKSKTEARNASKAEARNASKTKGKRASNEASRSAPSTSSQAAKRDDSRAKGALYSLDLSAAQAVTQPATAPGFSRRAATIMLIWGGALLLAAPYLRGIKTAASPPRLLPFPASPMREWGLLWGIFAAGWLAFLAYCAPSTPKTRLFYGSFGALFGAYALACPWSPADPALLRPDPFVLPLILFLLAFSIYGALRATGTARFLCFLAVAGLVALGWSETTWAGFLGDPKNPGFNDYKRQDTVFKFGLQTWMLWGIAASCGAYASFKKWPRVLQIGVMPALGVMAVASIAVAFGRARNFEKWDGWDGWAHLAPGEKAAASWLLANAKPGENLLEAEQAEGGDYSPYARYSSATGIPALVGPRAHTFQWSPANAGDIGAEWGEVERRRNLARALYTDFRGARRRAALQDCGARFIIFGELERDQYGENALQSLQNDPDLSAAVHFSAPEKSDAGTPRDVWIFRVR